MPKKTELDRFDYAILEILQMDATITNKQLSKQIGLSPPATLERVRKLIKKDYIRGSSYEINWEKLGYKFRVLIVANVKKVDEIIFPVVIQKHSQMLQTFKIVPSENLIQEEGVTRFISIGVFKDQEDFLKAWSEITASIGNYVRFHLWELEYAQRDIKLPPIL